MKSIANFGKRIKVLRARQGLTQAAFAQRLGVTPSYLNLVEHDRRPVSANLLIRLAQITDLDLKSLAAGEDTQLIAALMEAFGDRLAMPGWRSPTIRRTAIRSSPAPACVRCCRPWPARD